MTLVRLALTRVIHVTNFHVCNLRFAHKPYCFYRKIIKNISKCSKKIIICWKNKFKKTQISVEYVKNIQRILNCFHENHSWWGGGGGGGGGGWMGRAFICITENSKFKSNVFPPILRILLSKIQPNEFIAIFKFKLCRLLNE